MGERRRGFLMELLRTTAPDGPEVNHDLPIESPPVRHKPLATSVQDLKSEFS